MNGSIENRTESPPQPGHRQRLLIVDPDRLTRWSIKAYFDPLFDVEVAESATSVYKLLAQSAADAVVMADDLPSGDADAIESRARSRNDAVRIVRMVTAPIPAEAQAAGMLCLEKPFELSSLARLLGVGARE